MSADLHAVVGIALALLAGCQPSQGATPDRRVYEATLDAWHATDMLPPVEFDGHKCAYLELFEMKAPGTVEAFARACPADSWACLQWRPLQGARSRDYPVAILHPAMPASLWASNGIHEILHALSMCAGLSTDNPHSRKGVVWWSGGGVADDSVEWRANAALGYTAVPAPEVR